MERKLGFSEAHASAAGHAAWIAGVCRHADKMARNERRNPRPLRVTWNPERIRTPFQLMTLER